MNLLQLYESMLLTAGLTVSKDGSVSVALNKRKDPLTIRGKRLVIPTDEQLKTPDFSNRVVFHPLAENILSVESEAFARYRKAMLARINSVFGTMMFKLMLLAASPAEHKKLSPEQSEFLLKLKDVDDKCVDNLRKLLEKTDFNSTEYSFVHIYVKRSGTYLGHKLPKVAITSFPFYNKLVEAESDRTINGVKLRVRDYESIKNLLEFIIPKIADPGEEYNFGSDSKISPVTVSFMSAVKKIITPLNRLVELYVPKESEEEFDSLYFRNDWIPLIDNLDPLLPEIRMIPNQESLESDMNTFNAELQQFNSPQQPVAQAPVQAAPVAQPVPSQQPQQPQYYQQPVQQPVQPYPQQQQPVYQQPVQQQATGGDDLDSFIAKSNMQKQQAYYQGQFWQQPPVPQYQPQPVGAMWGNPAPVYQQPVQPQPYYQQPVYAQAPQAPVQQPFQQQTGNQVVGYGEYGYPIIR